MRKRLNSKRIITGGNRPIKNTKPDFVCDICGLKGWYENVIEYACHFRQHDEGGGRDKARGKSELNTSHS